MRLSSSLTITLCCGAIATGLCDHLSYHAVFLSKQGSKQVLDLDLGMIVLHGYSRQHH